MDKQTIQQQLAGHPDLLAAFRRNPKIADKLLRLAAEREAQRRQVKC